MPLTSAELELQLAREGFFVSQRDVEGFLRDLAIAGDRRRN
jgi:hypothetical protein